MEKPFDIKALVKMLKDQGLPVAEDAGQAVATVAFAWIKLSVELTKTPIDDMFLPQLAALEKSALAGLDKIDGVIGQ